MLIDTKDLYPHFDRMSHLTHCMQERMECFESWDHLTDKDRKYTIKECTTILGDLRSHMAQMLLLPERKEVEQQLQDGRLAQIKQRRG